MGTFTININEKVYTPYQSSINSLAKAENCSGFIFERTLSISGNNFIADNTILLSTHNMDTVGLTWKTMYIKDYISTDNNKLWIEYNGNKLDSNELIIDITGLNYDDIIPLLLFKGSQDPLNNTTQIITCNIALEDNTNQKYEYRSSQLTVYYGTCSS